VAQWSICCRVGMFGCLGVGPADWHRSISPPRNQVDPPASVTHRHHAAQPGASSPGLLYTLTRQPARRTRSSSASPARPVSRFDRCSPQSATRRSSSSPYATSRSRATTTRHRSPSVPLWGVRETRRRVHRKSLVAPVSSSATVSAMPGTGPGQSLAGMLRRIRELQAAGPALGHVTEQHLTSKVLLKRFAEPSGPHRGLICPFRLEYPRPGTGSRG
jgi:hypothetical protein